MFHEFDVYKREKAAGDQFTLEEEEEPDEEVEEDNGDDEEALKLLMSEEGEEVQDEEEGAIAEANPEQKGKKKMKMKRRGTRVSVQERLAAFPASGLFLIYIHSYG